MPTENRPIRALSVDDHPDTAEALARLLQAMGCAATFVTDPAKAIDAASAIEAEIIFLDIGMPGIDGYQLAKMFRTKYGEAVLLVAVTAYGSAEHHRKSREAGFDAHVQKPVDIRIVESMLATVLASRRGRSS
jgi:CheY-like chemotaxis protein